MPPQKKLRTGTVPVTILTGFLGSGKTTLLNHILESPDHGMRFAIIENEFGAASVDDKVIQETTEEQIIEVVNGCICCNVRGDLANALKKMQARINNFDGIIIETTGLADPAPVAQTFFTDPSLQRVFHLDSIITVVDAMHVLDHLREKKPEGVVNECVEQVAFADRVLLNKCDLVEAGFGGTSLDEIEKEIRDINSEVEIIRTQYGQVEPARLINIKAFELDRALEINHQFLGHQCGKQNHDQTVGSESITFVGDLNHQQLRMWLSELQESHGKDLFRYKGVLSVKGMLHKFVFQGVHMLFNGKFDQRFPWKRDEVRECRLVFIGRNLDRNSLERGVMNCRVVGPLRFRVGDVVEASCEAWCRGRVIQLWDEGNPYRIRLDSGEEVWGPVDTDEFVRAPAQGKGAAWQPRRHQPWWGGGKGKGYGACGKGAGKGKGWHDTHSHANQW